ncbi:Lrp/AsnC family transcriptional regulator [Affinibrenneria salicis]|uniref:Lrp/AsnC family transcriptional regulator n=1 Tax=Affinibrenneria salicis TaxID=2590031 RepID=A0A5J5FYR5_9GAMM|nr:Lrp/AsnC family transcriptional regulator [Affinibrenneria salicis]KAA8999372.1 Lrp/AsnC family transcriptional regulator [Affinibrenneria salicis]
MNDIDRKIIALLRDNARLPISELAKKTGVSRVTLQKRIRLLESSGEIAGYTVRLKPQQDDRIRAWMSIAVEGNKAAAIIQDLRGEPAIATLHTTNGRWDILVEIHCDTLGKFDSLLGRIRRIPGVANSETSILLSTRKV